jgi:transcriptional regulator with GAF, ATPase, and Fis domain
LLPRYGQVILVGLFLAVFAHVWEISYTLLNPLEINEANAVAATFFSVERIHLLISLAGFTVIAIGVSVAVLGRKQSASEILNTRQELEISKYFEYQAEERFRYLFDSTSNSVYCYRFDPPMSIDLPVAEQVARSYDAVLQDCNVNFARDLEADDPSEVIGSRMGDLDSSKDTVAHEAYFKTFIEGDYRLDGYDLVFRNSDGDSRSLLVNMVGIVRDGLLRRMWAVESNVTDLREVRKALALRRKFQGLVASISSRLVMAADEEADAIIDSCMKDVCNFANADRSTMFWLNSGDDSAAIAYIWSPDGKPFGPMLMNQIPAYWARLESLEPLRINDVEGLPEEFKADRSELEKHDLKSVVVVPMVVGGEAVGGMIFGRSKQQKDWTDQEVEDLKVFAELFANFVLRLKSRRELDTALRQLQQATDRLEAENVYLRQEIELTHGFDEIIGRSEAVLRSLQLVEKVAPTKTPVLILGETGTGKELIARAIHELSDRCMHPLVKVNCAALPASLIESELFGHEKGAFTGADNAKRGRFDLAHGSTLFLDEIGEIPVELQSKLLRVLQEGEFDRLGGSKTINVDVRLIVATNRDLAIAVQAGEFRSDLYYRINTFPIEMPPLRDRGDDIQLLAKHFVNVHAPRLGRDVTEISAEMMDQLQHYRWPGNVRELEGIIQRALISSRGPVLDLAERLVVDTENGERSTVSANVSDLRFIEREHIVAVLEDSAWKIAGASGAAVKLGIPPSTLRSKMKKLHIVRPH